MTQQEYFDWMGALFNNDPAMMREVPGPAALEVYLAQNLAPPPPQSTVDQKISAAAKKFGLDEEYLRILSKGTNPNWAHQMDPEIRAIYGSAATQIPGAPPLASRNQALPVDDGSPTPPPSGTVPSFSIVMPDGTVQTFNGALESNPAIDAALKSGGRVWMNGQFLDSKQFQGGWIVNTASGWTPLNAIYGEWLPGQRDALTAAGIQPGTPGVSKPGDTPSGGAGGPVGSGQPWFGDANVTASQLPTGLGDALASLMQESLNQGRQSQERYSGLVDDLKNYLGFARSAAEQTYNRRNELTDSLLGKITPGIESAIGTMNDATGLSPEAQAALRAQAIEGSAADYQNNIRALKSQLGARGAYGGGDTPGDLGAILGGYAPLMASRDTARSTGLANAILANEQRKLDTLKLNRETASNAMNTGAGLTSSLASAYNPAPFFSANEGALSGLNSALGGINAAGFSGLNAAGGFGNTLSSAATNQAELGTRASISNAQLANALQIARLGNNNALTNSILGAALATGGNILSSRNNPSIFATPSTFPSGGLRF